MTLVFMAEALFAFDLMMSATFVFGVGCEDCAALAMYHCIWYFVLFCLITGWHEGLLCANFLPDVSRGGKGKRRRNRDGIYGNVVGL